MYHALGDHTEVFQAECDPDDVACQDLLELVFESHDPQHQTTKPEYQNVVFDEAAAQRATLDEFLTAWGLTADGIGTRVEQLSRSYLAEEYHQKYALRSVDSFTNAFEAARYGDDELRESTIAAALNGYAAGHDVAVADELPVQS